MDRVVLGVQGWRRVLTLNLHELIGDLSVLGAGAG